MDVKRHLPDRQQKRQVRVNIQVPGEGKRAKFANGVMPSLCALFTLHLRQLLVQALPRWIVVGKTWATIPGVWKGACKVTPEPAWMHGFKHTTF